MYFLTIEMDDPSQKEKIKGVSIADALRSLNDT